MNIVQIGQADVGWWRRMGWQSRAGICVMIRRNIHATTVLCLCVSLMFSGGRRAFAQTTPGINLADLAARLKVAEDKIASLGTRLTTAEALIASLQDQINHLPAGPQGPKGDPGPAGASGLAYHMYPTVLPATPLWATFTIEDGSPYNLYAIDPNNWSAFPYTACYPVIRLPHANSVPAGTVIMIRQQPTQGGSGYSGYGQLMVGVQDGDALDSGEFANTFQSAGSWINFQSLAIRVYSDGQNHWWSDARMEVPKLMSYDGGG